MKSHMPEGVIPESRPVWVTFDDKIFMPSILNHSYQLDGSAFFYEIFTYLELFTNVQKNVEGIQKACEKMNLILKYFDVNFSNKKCGKLAIFKRKFNSLNEVMKLNTNFVFNCMGAFSKEIFPDENLIPLKGSMVYLKNNDHIKNYLAIYSFDNNVFSILPTASNIAIGVTTSKNPVNGDEDKVIVESLFKKAQNFFKPKF